MSNAASGYTDITEHRAVRISDNGEVITRTRTPSTRRACSYPDRCHAAFIRRGGSILPGTPQDHSHC